MKAFIKTIETGKQKGQFCFVLKAKNNKTIAISEAYRNKRDCLKTLTNYFPDFTIIGDAS